MNRLAGYLRLFSRQWPAFEPDRRAVLVAFLTESCMSGFVSWSAEPVVLPVAEA